MFTKNTDANAHITRQIDRLFSDLDTAMAGVREAEARCLIDIHQALDMFQAHCVVKAFQTESAFSTTLAGIDKLIREQGVELSLDAVRSIENARNFLKSMRDWRAGSLPGSMLN